MAVRDQNTTLNYLQPKSSFPMHPAIQLFHLQLLSGLLVLSACGQEQVPEPPNAFEFGKRFYESDDDSIMHSIDEPGLPSVILTRSGNSIGIGIFQQQTGAPIASLRDDDGDGVFEYIMYSALNAEGYSMATVEDFTMDGFPDFVLYLKNGKPAAKVGIGNEWIDVNDVGIGSPPNPTVEIDGETIALEEVLDSLGRP